MNHYEKFCEELFPDLYKVAFLITGDSAVASELAVNTVVQGVNEQHSMKNLTDARFAFMGILYALCLEGSFDAACSAGCGKLAALDYPDRCLAVFRHCSGLRFRDFCRIIGWTVEIARGRLAKIASVIL